MPLKPPKPLPNRAKRHRRGPPTTSQPHPGLGAAPRHRTAARVRGHFLDLRALSPAASCPLVAICGLRRPCSRRRAPHATDELDPARPRAARRRAVHVGTSGSRARGWRGPGCGHSRTANPEVVAVFDHEVRGVGAHRVHLQDELGLRLRQREDLARRRNVGARHYLKLAAPA